MKKSEKYSFAMRAVVESNLHSSMKLEIIEMLMMDKIVAESCEKADKLCDEVKE